MSPQMKPPACTWLHPGSDAPSLVLETVGSFTANTAVWTLVHDHRQNSVIGDDPQHEVWVFPGLLLKILVDFDTVRFLLKSQETANAHLSVVKKTGVTQVVVMIKRFNLECSLTKVIAYTFYMYINMQPSIRAQQVSRWFLITPCISWLTGRSEFLRDASVHVLSLQTNIAYNCNAG